MSSRPFRIALNGYGRIGRCVLRALQERKLPSNLQIVAINDLADLASIEYLTRFDSTHGRFPAEVTTAGDNLIIDGHCIQVLRQAAPEDIDWQALNLDLLLECSGQYTNREQAMRFINAGVPRLLLSQPMASAEDVDATIIYGFNQQQLTGQELLISNASCTTNCGVPVLHLLNQAFAIEQAFITTIHSAMNDQPVIDAYHHPDLRRTRSAFQSIIPVSTGLARGIERLLPELTGRITAKAVRVPTVNVSCLDITLQVQKQVDKTAVNQVLQQAAGQAPLQGLLGFTELPHASCDFNHDQHSAIFDASLTQVSGGHFVNLVAWFDNEWGFANRMLDVAEHFLYKAANTSH